MVSAMYREANSIPANRFVAVDAKGRLIGNPPGSDPMTQITDRLGDRPPVYVLLDDIAGGGRQIRRRYTELRGILGPDAQIVLSPTHATRRSLQGSDLETLHVESAKDAKRAASDLKAAEAALQQAQTLPSTVENNTRVKELEELIEVLENTVNARETEADIAEYLLSNSDRRFWNESDRQEIAARLHTQFRKEKIRRGGRRQKDKVQPFSYNLGLREISAIDDNLHIIPGRVSAEIQDSPWFAGLDQNTQRLVQRIMGGSMHDSRMMLSLFYMSPNNNARFFADMLAPRITIHPNGVKHPYSMNFKNEYNIASYTAAQFHSELNSDIRTAVRETGELLGRPDELSPRQLMAEAERLQRLMSLTTLAEEPPIKLAQKVEEGKGRLTSEQAELEADLSNSGVPFDTRHELAQARDAVSRRAAAELDKRLTEIEQAASGMSSEELQKAFSELRGYERAVGPTPLDHSGSYRRPYNVTGNHLATAEFDLNGRFAGLQSQRQRIRQTMDQLQNQTLNTRLSEIDARLSSTPAGSANTLELASELRVLELQIQSLGSSGVVSNAGRQNLLALRARTNQTISNFIRNNLSQRLQEILDEVAEGSLGAEEQRVIERELSFYRSFTQQRAQPAADNQAAQELSRALETARGELNDLDEIRG